MIRFRDENDRMMFMMEVGKSPSDSDTPADHNIFIQRRSLIVPLLKNFRRSQASKSGWNAHRSQIMFGIRKFHRGIEGLRLHRQMGRFLATRNFIPSEGITSLRLTRESKENLKSLLSQLITESQHYNSLCDQVEIELLIEEISGALS